MKIKKISIAVCAVLWIISLLLFYIRIPIITEPYSSTRLFVGIERTTGPSYYVLRGADELKEAIPSPHPEDLNTNEIELTGKSLHEWTEYPVNIDTSFRYVITGEYIGLTDDYQITGSGTIPVFRVDTITPVGPIADWIAVKFGFYGLALLIFLYSVLSILNLFIFLFYIIKIIIKCFRRGDYQSPAEQNMRNNGRLIAAPTEDNIHY
jgi:hypothetical protein